MKRAITEGFTLVELLIVIALIAILSVAVLATINPIEQSNKAKDSTVQNDAAEMMNAYERMYANSNTYPWMLTADSPLITVDSALVLRSDAYGFGICGLGGVDTGIGNTGLANVTGRCVTAGTKSDDEGVLVAKDELKQSFAGKDEFQAVSLTAADGLWLYKAAGSGGSIYVCYIPRAKSNRSLIAKLWCLDQTDKVRCTLGTRCTGASADCTAATVGSWGTPDLTGKTAMFLCVPN